MAGNGKVFCIIISDTGVPGCFLADIDKETDKQIQVSKWHNYGGFGQDTQGFSLPTKMNLVKEYELIGNSSLSFFNTKMFGRDVSKLIDSWVEAYSGKVFLYEGVLEDAKKYRDIFKSVKGSSAKTSKKGLKLKKKK